MICVPRVLLRLGAGLLRLRSWVRIYAICHKHNNMIFIVFFLMCLGFTSLSWGGAYVPDALWEGELVSGAVLSVAVGDVDGDGRGNLVVLDEQKAVVYASLDVLGALATLTAKKHRQFHRVWVADVDGDGIAEVLINGFQNDSIFSTLYRVQDGDFKLWQDFYGKIVIPWGNSPPTSLPYTQRGGDDLLSQDQKGRWAWSQVLSGLHWNKDQFEETQKLRLKNGVGWQRVSLFDVAGLEGHLVINRNDGTLELAKDGKALWRSGMKYGGAVDAIKFNSRDPMGIVREERFGIAPRLLARTVVEKIMPITKAIPDLPHKNRKTSLPEEVPQPVLMPRGSELIAVRNDGFLEGVIGKFARMKSAEIVQLEWTGKILHEKQVSRRFDGAISDMAVLDFDGDGLKNEILVSFWVRQGGMLETMAPKKSVLAVIRLK